MVDLTLALAQIIAELERDGVHVWRELDEVRLSPADGVGPRTIAALRERKADLLALLGCRDRERGRPIAAGQSALCLLQRLDPSSVAYNLSYVVRAERAVPVEAWRGALQAVVERHPILKLSFREVDGETRAFWNAEATQLGTRSAGSWEEALTIADTHAETAFDLAAGAPWRAVVIEGPGFQAFVWVIHHVLADMHSLGVLVAELSRELGAQAGGCQAGAAPEDRFMSQVREQQVWSGSEDAARSRAWWQQVFASKSEPLRLPSLRARPPLQSFAGGVVHGRVPAQLALRVAEAARRARVTTSAFLLTAYFVLLHRLSGQANIVVGLPTAGLRGPSDARAIGPFTNPVPIRANLAGGCSFSTLLGQVHAATLSALEHQRLPFAQLVESINPERDVSRSPVFQAMYTFARAHEDALALGQPHFPSCRQRGAPTDLFLVVQCHGQELLLSWSYASEVLDRNLVLAMSEQLDGILEAAIAQMDCELGGLPIVTGRDMQLLAQRNANERPVPEGETVISAFCTAAERFAAATALVDGARAVPYAELSAWSERWARALTALGCTPGQRVGLCLERGPSLVAAMLAILRAGAAYVPLDPGLPRHRRQLIATDAAVQLVIGDSLAAAELAAEGRAVISPARLDAEPEANLVRAELPVVSPDAVAYLLYTSGSTGQPKGVVVTHDNLANLFVGLDERVGTGPEHRWLAHTTISFDISVLELLWTLCRGCSVVLQRTAPRQGATARSERRQLGWSLFYFSSEAPSGAGEDPYHLLREGARFADEQGFEAVWVPERHFHAFGGAFPNPALMAASLASITRCVQLRAGSVVLPLHDPLRVAEEWAVVDWLSGGRAGIAFASGWHADDFVLAPQRYATRKSGLLETIEEVRRLWRGEGVERVNGEGEPRTVMTHPRPRSEIPLWLTSAGSGDTFERAGAAGFRLLTHLLGQNRDEFAEKVRRYRAASLAAGHGNGHVTLMLHTFVGKSREHVEAHVKEPFKNYLRSSIDLMAGLARSLGLDPQEHRELLVQQAYERFRSGNTLMGSVGDLVEQVVAFQALGVDELACLVDFGVAGGEVLESLQRLAELKSLFERFGTPEPELEHRDLESTLQAEAITHLQVTPSLARILLGSARGRSALQRLDTLLVGGDALRADLAAELFALGGPRVFNMYGPTETTVWSAAEVCRGQLGRVGPPLANQRLYVLDDRRQPVPAGVVGELCIAGRGVSRGYWGRAEQTRARFIAEREGHPERMYCTGDLVRVLPDGAIEFVGRADDQVKIRGHRIELGEIELVLAQHPAVRQAAVVALPAAGELELAAFAVLVRPGAGAADALASHLSERLPDYMLPRRVTLIDELPLTFNAKVDRAALRALALAVRAEAAGADDESDDPTERAIASLWGELLGHPRVSADANFFDLGGHSVMASRMVAELAARGVGSVALVDAFNHPTVRGLARHLRRQASSLVEELDAAQARASKQRRSIGRRRAGRGDR